MISFCPNFKHVLLCEKNNGADLMVLRARCGMWSCEYCAPINQAHWRKHLDARIEALGGKWSFMTLTAHQEAHKGGWTLVNLRDAFKPVYDGIRNNFATQKPIDYVRVFEMHLSHEFHIHMLWRINLEPFTDMDKWLKELVTHHGLGWRCEWKAAYENSSTPAITRYVTKYLTKAGQGAIEMPKGIRRIQTSHGIGALKKEKSDDGWHLASGVYRGELKFYERVIDVSTGHLVTERDFRGWTVYPPELDKEDVED